MVQKIQRRIMIRIALITITLLWGLSTTQLSFSQDWKWGEDIVKAKGNWAYFRNLVSAKKYDEAAVKIPWFLNNTPDLNENLYIKASQVYEARVEAEKDAEKLEVLKDSALLMYDMRMKYYPENKANILNRKGLLAWNYLSRRDGVAQELYDLYNKIYETNGDEMFIPNATAWMFAAVSAKQNGLIQEDELWEVYGNISGYLDGQREQYAENENVLSQIDQNEDLINRKFLRAVKLECEDFETRLGAKFRESKDLKLAKRLQNMMFRNGCTNSPLFKEVLAFVLESEPNTEGYKYMGYILAQEKQYAEAIAQYEKAIELSTSDKTKAGIYMDIANLYQVKGQKASARSNAMKAVSLGGNSQAAYTLIGDLYYSSYDQCKSTDIISARAVYIAAYNMYEKAGNEAKMIDAKDQFPTMEEIHQRNKSLGDQITIECWINETVALQKR